VDPGAARDWTYIEDTAAALIHLARVPRLRHDLYNVSCGRPVSLWGIAQIIARHVPATFVIDEAADAEVSVGPTERRSPLDITRLRSTGFSPRVTVEEGVARYLEWLRGEGVFTIGDT
jgi:dTDP-L-rhamnose 4-epimerase